MSLSEIKLFYKAHRKHFNEGRLVIYQRQSCVEFKTVIIEDEDIRDIKKDKKRTEG